MLRIEQLLKEKKVSKPELARRMGLSKQSMYARLNANYPSTDTLFKISEILEVEIHELFDTSEAYGHWYDVNTGEWLGIHKK